MSDKENETKEEEKVEEAVQQETEAPKEGEEAAAVHRQASSDCMSI